MSTQRKRKTYLVLAGLLCAGMAVSWLLLSDGRSRLLEKLTGSRPNIVLIIIDTLRADKMRCYGFPGNTSPELDEMAKRGVRFNRVVAQCSWTRPSIGSMLTALYPRTIGIYKEEADSLNDRFTTLAEALQAHGYKTVGLTANPNLNKAYNFHQGFDHYVDSIVVFPWMKPQEGQVPLKGHNMLSARDLFTRALELVGSGEEGPYYIQLNVMEVHEWYQKPNRSLIRAPFSFMFPKAPNKTYLQALRQLSEDINDFAKKLKSLPGFEDTLFVLTSDHGEGLNDHPDVWYSIGHGRYLYESQVMVPLIFYHSGGDLPARTVEQRVRLLDLMPTLLDYVGAPVPEGLHGVSLLPLIRGETNHVSLPECFVTETELRSSRKIATYSPAWKYIENLEVGKNRHKGYIPLELQAIGVKENGAKTNSIASQQAAAGSLRSFLRDWETRFPKEPSTRSKQSISPEEIEQLRSLGYLQ